MKLSNEKYSELISLANSARGRSYSPFSHFAVGAALLTKEGKIYTGTNVENSSYGATVCAERVAFFGAVHAGEKKFKAIAIVGGKAREPISAHTPPCGVCRQVMAEFCDGDFLVITSDGKEERVKTLNEIFPDTFSGKNLD